MEINELIQRKHFLLRALYNHNASDKQAAKNEIAKLEIQIKEHTKQVLESEREKLQEQLKIIKKTVTIEGEFKRAIANAIIHILKDDLSPSDLKGVFRQGYKIMRTRC